MIKKMEKIELLKIIGTIKKYRSFGVSIDSRTTEKGDIFFAIKGEKYDGHDYIYDAIFKKGAIAAVVSRTPDFMSDKHKRIGKNPQLPVIIVKDTLLALQEFAKYYREIFNPKTIGITGSNGKTTTKNILASIISQKHSVLSTQGNFNNHIGLPLTLFKLNKNHKYCVLEMGANHKGEIARLCEIANPTCGIITNIGFAHIGNFGSLRGILNAKMELFNYLGKNDIAVVNNDDELISLAAKSLKCNKITFGINSKSDIMASDFILKADKTNFNIKIDNRITKVEIPVPGMFNVYNALAATGCAVSLKISVQDIVNGLKNFIPQGMRMEMVKLENGVIVVNDSYNANPTSMHNAIENFSKIFYNKRKVLVLGDMLELGNYGEREHEKIGEFIFKNKLADVVYTVGKLAKSIADSSNGIWFKNKNELSKYLKINLKKGDAVFFKASRGAGIEEVIKNIQTKNK
ncbi:MAG: UDP-N-acetylmuramoyl-tripeptide--D-alanyl-D-alanine ligase [Elusimicrobia bacterium]|nr:UDP-N-acetylmuramoyl-tripeptide--D-alanyl-D-alanine ligase [Elusimicrobiota bacterium]